MSANGWLQILIYSILIATLTKPVGLYLYRIFAEQNPPFPRFGGALEHWIFRFCGVNQDRQQNWKEYTLSVLIFSFTGILVCYFTLRLQDILPFNPQDFQAIAPDLALNTAVSFTTNTNWQSYSGETTLSYFSQMVALSWQNFVSAASGLGIALALARGLTSRQAATNKETVTIGNFWVDLLRAIIYLFLPLSLAGALFLVSQGVVQTLGSYQVAANLEGSQQTIALGPVASQEIIKILGINGGGFFNANSAHPFENPTPLTNFLQMILIFAIPAGLTYMYGRMARDQKEGWVILGAMALLFLTGVTTAYWAEARGNTALAGLPVNQSIGNLEGKEMRFGVAGSSLFAAITTGASCGAVNAMHDSFTPLGGLVPLINIQLGEVIFGGVGAGLYGILVFVLLAVFISGLMVGRTPEYLGKKVGAREIKLAMLYVLIFPLLILGLSAWAAVSPYGMKALNNGGPHGLTEILYAYSSCAGNNGSAFAGLGANTPWWNISLSLSMLLGRFWMIIPVMGIAGSMAAKKTVPPNLGTFPTNGLLFMTLLVGVIIILGALTFFPVLSLGPILEECLAGQGKLF